MEYNSGSNRATNFKSARGRFEITSLITPELYDTKSYYQLIVPKTKCENLSLGIFINVRNRFLSKNMTGFNFGCGSPTAWWSFFQKSIFLIKIHVRQYLNEMGEFLKVMELKYSLSRQHTDSKAKDCLQLSIMNIPKEPEIVQHFWTEKWLTTSSTIGTLRSRTRRL